MISLKTSRTFIARTILVHSRNLLGMSAVIFAAANFHAQTLPIIPTTTLAKETANNTSAAGVFKGTNNGNVAPANVSKVRTSSLLYPGATTNIYAHFMGWFAGGGDHKDFGYISNDPSVVHKQVGDMISRGIAGAIIDWHGPGHITDQTTQLLMKEAETRPAFQFAITEDVGAVAAFAKTNNCDATQKLIEDLNTAYTKYQLSPAYMRIAGRPVVFFFGTEAYFIDWARARAEVTGNPLFIFRNAGAFTQVQSDGGYSWLERNANDPYDMGLGYLDEFYSTALAHPAQSVVGSAYPGFNDTIARWSGNRVMHQQCGQTWLASFAEAGKFFSTTKQLPSLQIVTWNDYEEGTQIETGLDNCFKLLASMSLTTRSLLTWKLEGKGLENTIYYYRVLISTNGENLMRLKDLKPGIHALDLATFPLAAGTYTLYVKAVGRPSVQNKMSGPVTYNPADRAPIAKLSLSATTGTVPFTVTASTSGSSDPDGKIVSSQIDFGDGTVLNGPVATHIYNSFGPFTVTGRVYGNLNVFSADMKKVQVKPPRSGVIIWSPANGSTINSSFVNLVATASAANTITSMTVYLDTKAIYRLRGDRIDTLLKMFDGTRKLTVNAWDSTGAVSSTSIFIKVGLTANLPPIADLTLSTFSTTVGVPVRACTAASTDPEKSGLSSVIDFGDGTPSAIVKNPFGLHAYSSPGTYTVKATLTDNRGGSSSTSRNITVQ